MVAGYGTVKPRTSATVFSLFDRVSWRSAWRAALKRAGLQIRFHDLRHTCITELAESQASEHTRMAIAGHVSRKMIEHYSHIRMEAKRAVLDAIVNAQSSQAVLWGRCEPKREPNPGGRFEGFH
jgi:integrase